MAGPSYPGQREAVASSVRGTPQPPRMAQRAYQQQRVNGPAQRTWKKLSESHSSQLRLLSVRGPLRPSLARRRRGSYHGMAPRAGFFVTAEWQVGNGTMALETDAGRLNRNCWKPSSPSCGTTEKANLEGQGDRGWRPCSAMKAMLLESGTRVLTESQVLICEVGTIRLLISKVEICITG